MISVVTWDAGFRESYHTVDFFSHQSIGIDQFEFIWADYYSTINSVLQEKVQAMGNGRTFCFGGEGKWHLGRTLNAAIRESKGDLIVIPDGDVVVEETFLEQVANCHAKNPDAVTYFRRWDEQSPDGGKGASADLQTLQRICRLTNPTNYGGCLTLSRRVFNSVGGYEEHELFSEAGANGLELYTRLKNAGLPIVWHPTRKIYHPWHEGTAPSDPEYRLKVELQNWIIRKRDLEVTSVADAKALEGALLSRMGAVAQGEPRPSLPRKVKGFFLGLVGR